VSSKQVEDAVIARCQSWLADHYAEPSPVAAMIAMSGLAERSFNRRFVQATGTTPLQYVHAVRIEEAKQLLETSDLAIEAIANEVGYEDSSFFGRLFSRNVGVTPAQYRRRFAPLRRAVQPR
jgi:transcriptional regulator GlxA family with amidase domain